MKAVITGSAGFVGQHLTKHLLEKGHEVIGFNLRDEQDVEDYEQVRNFLDIHRPDAIFHLAARAFVGESFSNPRGAFRINGGGTMNFLEAMRQLGLKNPIMIAGSSEEYGDGEPSEEAMLCPKSPYAISKITADLLGQMYAKAYGLHVVVTRAFNHTGPGRGAMYAESSFAKQIAEIEAGKRHILSHGNLESIRNYTDVRDIVRAYALAVDLPSGVYNICSDKSVSMQEVLDILTNLAIKPIKTKVDPALYRPLDFSFKKPNCDRFTELTKWNSKIELIDTLKDLLNYWRQQCGTLASEAREKAEVAA